MANTRKRHHKRPPSVSGFTSKGTFSRSAPQMFKVFSNEEERHKYAQDFLSGQYEFNKSAPKVQVTGKRSDHTADSTPAPLLPPGQILGPFNQTKKSLRRPLRANSKRDYTAISRNLGLAKQGGWKAVKNVRNFLGNTTLANLKTQPWAIVPIVDLAFIVVQGFVNVSNSLEAQNSTYLSAEHNLINRHLDVSFNVIDTVANLSNIFKALALLRVAQESVCNTFNAIDTVAGIASLAIVIAKTIYDASIQGLRKSRCQDSEKKFAHRKALYQQLSTTFNPHTTYDQNNNILLHHFVSAEISRLTFKLRNAKPTYFTAQDASQKYKATTQLNLLLRLEKKLKSASANRKYEELTEQDKMLLQECVQLNAEKLKVRQAIEADIKKDLNGSAFKLTRFAHIALAIVLFNVAPVAIPGALTFGAIAVPLFAWGILVFWNLAHVGRLLSRTDWGKEEFASMEKATKTYLDQSTLLANHSTLRKAVEAVLLPFQYITLTFKAIPHYAPIFWNAVTAKLGSFVKAVKAVITQAPEEEVELLQQEKAEPTPAPSTEPVKSPAPDSWQAKKASYAQSAAKNEQDWQRLRANHPAEAQEAHDYDNTSGSEADYSFSL